MDTSAKIPASLEALEALGQILSQFVAGLTLEENEERIETARKVLGEL